MSKARRVLLGETLLVTRRCLDRKFLLVPRERLREIFIYCLGHAAALHDIEVHGFVVMSNHYHIICTDVDGDLPAFCRWLNGHLAKLINWELKRPRGQVWDARKYSRVRLADDDAVLRELAYVITNPVAAGAVEQPSQWPGLIVLAKDIGKTWTADRPAFFRIEPESDGVQGGARHRKDRPVLPPKATLELTPPPLAEKLALDRLQERLERQVAERVEALHRDRPAGTYQGAEAVQRVHHEFVPSTPDAPRGSLGPTFATRHGALWKTEVEQLLDFRAKYEKARAAYLRGERDVEFPAGTYLMRIQLGVRCAAA